MGVGLTGIDHLPDHLSVQRFSVDGRGGAQAGKGGSLECCGSLPRKWQPDLTVKVRWNVTNWRDCKGEEHEEVVPVEPYDEIGRLYVHFFSDGSVRAVSSALATPRSPDYKGPHDRIPQKYPWQIYNLDLTCSPPESPKQ
ncbi:DUF3304 domain-containing protein [Pseudomonas sp. R5(2019)]|nr:DUF3304 domain-containing protein [Pseudomonas sp. R5(2019)]NBA97758.1 DUF3304 domain-containing protein [Pseudomonas sp. R5(2019)]